MVTNQKLEIERKTCLDEMEMERIQILRMMSLNDVSDGRPTFYQPPSCFKRHGRLLI
jgi:hypothetical protein